jgi:uncharacterized protein (DUF885 family)
MPEDADTVFSAYATATLDGLLERDPVRATGAGDHRRDGTLIVGTAEHYEEVSRWAAGRLAALASLDTAQLSPELRVDAEMLANYLARLRFSVDELREHEWNPLLANPGMALDMLRNRDFAPLAERIQSAAGRLACVPAVLAAARSVAGAMPRVHIETALSQFAGTEFLIEHQLGPLAQEVGAAGRQFIAAMPSALEAIAEHRRWLGQQLADGIRDGFRDPRLGPVLYAKRLHLALDTDLTPEQLLSRAEADLPQAREAIAAAVAEFTGSRARGDDRVWRALGAMAADQLDQSTILPAARSALSELRKFVEAHDMITVFGDPVEVIEMPEIDRGGPLAYCDAPGQLETIPLPTFIAVSPPPESWPAERIRSYWRENNRHLLHLLMIHEAMPGHAVQIQHSSKFAGATAVRAVLWSASFLEGWAVYAEQQMCARGYPGEGNPAAVEIQRLKARLRSITNAIVDVRVHCLGMAEAEARALTTGVFQEPSSAAIQWARAQLYPASLPNYYIGFAEVCDLAAALRAANPAWPDRQLHDVMLAHGSPPVRHLRALLGVQPSSGA